MDAKRQPRLENALVDAAVVLARAAGAEDVAPDDALKLAEAAAHLTAAVKDFNEAIAIGNSVEEAAGTSVEEAA